MDTQSLMTTEHPLWASFVERLREACNFQYTTAEESDSAIECIWDCFPFDSEHSFARVLLDETEGIDVEASMQYLCEHDVGCDCGILLYIAKLWPQMTPEHPLWSEFVNTLIGEEYCNFSTDEKGEHQWHCDGSDDRPFAREIMKKTGGLDIEASLARFAEHGGFCDCEIYMNAMPSMESEYHDSLTE